MGKNPKRNIRKYAPKNTMKLMLSDVPTDQKFVILQWMRKHDNYAKGITRYNRKRIQDSLKDTFIKFERATDGIITCKCNCDIMIYNGEGSYVPGKCGHPLGEIRYKDLVETPTREATEAAISDALVDVHKAFDKHFHAEFDQADQSGMLGLHDIVHLTDYVVVDGKEGQIVAGTKDDWTFQPNERNEEQKLGVKDKQITAEDIAWKKHKSVWSDHKALGKPGNYRVGIVRKQLELELKKTHADYGKFQGRRLVSATLGRGEHHFDYLLGTLVLITGVAIMYFARRLFKRKAGVLIPEYQ